MSGSGPQSTRRQSPEQRARLLRVALGLLVTVSLVVIPLVTPGTLGVFTASIRNTVNSGTVMPFFSCREALTKETGRVFAYQFDTSPPVNLVTGNTSSTTVKNVTPMKTETSKCKHDTAGFLRFAGDTTKPSMVNYANSTAPSNTYTQEVWFRTKVASGSLMGMVSTADYRNELKFDRELYVGASGRLTMARYTRDAGPPQGVQSPLSVADGAWHHAVAVHDGSAQVASLYLDGDLVGTMSAVGALESYSPNFWRLGCTRIADGKWPDGPTRDKECFNGDMTFAAVYSRAFTKQDVTNHYKAGVWGS